MSASSGGGEKEGEPSCAPSTSLPLFASNDERRLFEYFCVAGLKDGANDQLSPAAPECGCRNEQPLAPITDITVFFPSLGETVPDGFTAIQTTPLGYPADLNHGSLRVPGCFLAYRRGYHKPPLVDIGVLDQGRGEKPMLDSNTVHATPFGRPANVNNASQGIFLTYRRAPPNSPPSQLVVTEICVILANKGEIPPHTYFKISKNLNKGMVGSDVYICYKKTQGTSKRLAYKPSILDSFPHDFPLAQNVPLFCLPMGALLECWPAKCQRPDKTFSTFVLTDQVGTKFYGASVAFYEPYDMTRLTAEQMEKLEVGSQDKDEVGAVEDSSSTNDPAEQMCVYTNVAICVISRYPFFHAFKRFLFHLYRMSVDGEHALPIERYISHLMYEVSFPTPRRPRVLMQLGAETIAFDSYDDSQLPLSGAQLFDALKSLGPDNLMYLVLLALLEQKILVHSLRPHLLTTVAESVCALLFPFHWQCPYIPQCPLALAGVLHAPLPFIAGVDSRYFDLYDNPPADVTCFDLDTCTISQTPIRHAIKLSMLPKKPAKQLRATLEKLYRTLQREEFSLVTMQKNSDYLPVDMEFQIQQRKKGIEIAVHDGFLKFMSQLMSGYQKYLCPITKAPQSEKATDTGNLFDLDGFLKSREKSAAEFFNRFAETQCFMRFIEERSFVSDRNAYNAFFDDCIYKVEASDERTEVSLLDKEVSMSANHTVFIAPPEAVEGGKTFSYGGRFPRSLDPSLFQLESLNITKDPNGPRLPVEHEVTRCAAVRTKPEVRSSLLGVAASVKADALNWPKILLFYAYSLWFMQLPALVRIAENKKKILRLAFHVLRRLEYSGVVPLDQVCYRILIQLCGDCGEPALAVCVLQAMRRLGLEQNAVTYGIYHRAVMNAEWPSPERTAAMKAWTTLRLVVEAAVLFRQGLRDENGRIRAVEEPEKATEKTADAASVSDNGYHSEPPTSKEGEEEDEELKGKPYVISYEPLPDKDETPSKDTDPLNSSLDDPLGASRLPVEEISTPQRKMESMSPSRIKFLKDHEGTPFATDLEEQKRREQSTPSKTSSWLRGLTNSPVFRMIRSSTFEDSPQAKGAANESMAVSPSLSSLVANVKKGVDNVMTEGVSSRLRHGVSTLVEEVRSLNRSYGPALGSGTLFPYEPKGNCFDIDEKDPAYQLDSGMTGAILPDEFWLAGEAKEEKENDEFFDVTLSTCTACPSCQTVLYDEEIMAGWKADDQNLNTECPFCSQSEGEEGGEMKGRFVPQLTVTYTRPNSKKAPPYNGRPHTSWYRPIGNMEKEVEDSDEESPLKISVSFVSPLVLRRELESLLAADPLSLSDPSVKETHPVVFWNTVYYLRRLSLTSHLFRWVTGRGHLRCVYDRPEVHKEVIPLYFLNPSNSGIPPETRALRSASTWVQVTGAVAESNLFRGIQMLINECRTVNDGQVVLKRHFPIFRDIQFASLDRFNRMLQRDGLDREYQMKFEQLPPRIASLLPLADFPQKSVQRACRKVFLPLDLF